MRAPGLRPALRALLDYVQTSGSRRGESSSPFCKGSGSRIIRGRARRCRTTGRITVAANVRFSNPKTMAKPPGYTYVVEATGPNRLIFIAGQLGIDMNNQLVGASGDFRAQAFRAFQNLKLALESTGAGFKDVVKINNYLVDMSHIGIFREVRDEFLNMAAVSYTHLTMPTKREGKIS